MVNYSTSDREMDGIITRKKYTLFSEVIWMNYR
jgi:hypothetical protein